MTRQCLRGRRICAAAPLVVVAFFAVGGAAHYRSEANRIYVQKHHELAAIAEMKVAEIAEWRKERLADASRAVGSPFFQRALEAWLNNLDDAELTGAWRERLDVERRYYGYDDVLLLDMTGNILLSARSDSHPVSASTDKAVQQALAENRAVPSDLFLCPEGFTHLDVAAPVPNAAKEAVAVLILRVNAEQYLYPLIQMWPTPSRSAETLLVQRDGEDALILNELRHRSGTALAMRIPMSQKNFPAVQAVLGRTGISYGDDYRGKPVLADVRPVPDSPWFLVAKEDMDEVLQEAHFLARVIAVFIFSALLLAAMVAAYVSRHRQAALYQSLYQFERAQREAQEEIRATLYSIGDGVITTDREGRVCRINPVAERLTGWTEAEAQSRPLDEVFRIVNEETRASVENPVQRVLAERKIVDLASRTLLIAKDGAECPIADSGAPILNSDGEVDGVVLVFRDQTAERVAERALRDSERFKQSNLDALSAHIAILDENGVIIGVNKAWREFALANADTVEGLAEGANYLSVCERTVGFVERLDPCQKDKPATSMPGDRAATTAALAWTKTFFPKLPAGNGMRGASLCMDD